ncbi:MAG: hypothetical protein VW644_06360 [Alphaproteobacteria bacterium]|jgi:hypothetical protein
MAVTGPTTPLSAVLSQIQAPLRPAPGTAPAQATVAAQAARPAAPTPPGGVNQSGSGEFNPNAPRGSYLNIVV